MAAGASGGGGDDASDSFERSGGGTCGAGSSAAAKGCGEAGASSAGGCSGGGVEGDAGGEPKAAAGMPPAPEAATPASIPPFACGCCACGWPFGPWTWQLSTNALVTGMWMRQNVASVAVCTAMPGLEGRPKRTTDPIISN